MDYESTTEELKTHQDNLDEVLDQIGDDEEAGPQKAKPSTSEAAPPEPGVEDEEEDEGEDQDLIEEIRDLALEPGDEEGPEAKAAAEVKTKEKATPAQGGAKAEPEKKAKPEDTSKGKAEAQGPEKGKAEAPKPDEPEKPKLLKVKIDEDEFELPEKLYEKVKGRLDQAEGVQEDYRQAVQAIVQDFPAAVLDILTSAYKGDREAAYRHFLAECRAVHKAEEEYENLDPAKRERLDLEHRATRAEAELERERQAKRREEEQAGKARQVERALGEIAGHMKALGIRPAKALAFRVLETAELLAENGKNFNLRDLVRHVHGEATKEETQRATQWEEEALKLPDDEFARRYPRVTEKARKADLARLKEERSTAKTPRPGAGGAERETAGSTNGKSPRRSFYTWD